MKALVNFLKKSVDGGKILLLCHHNADLDAVGSAIALSEVFKEKFPKAQVKIGVAESVSKAGSKLLAELGHEAAINPNPTDFDIIITLDISTPSQVSPIQLPLDKPIVVIDHHYSNQKLEQFTKYSLTDEKAAATGELVYRLLTELKAKITEKIGSALIASIITDSAHLRTASPITFRIIAEILEKTKINFHSVLALLEEPLDLSKKIAHLKAAQRLKIHRINDWVVVTSTVSSHEASASRGLLQLGADVTLVAATKEDQVRISGRARPEIIQKTGFHLARDVMIKIGETIGGTGGGHNAAAAANGPLVEKTENALKEAVKLIREYLRIHPTKA
ncbi:MAG: DHH family phosphoesterase [Euryarchaeota archaeon]|nr:DHH family phosphoesterase [Euryarchaeota archaeon]